MKPVETAIRTRGVLIITYGEQVDHFPSSASKDFFIVNGLHISIPHLCVSICNILCLTAKPEKEVVEEEG